MMTDRSKALNRAIRQFGEPRSADDWLMIALIESLRGHMDEVATCEHAAYRCSDFLDEKLVSYLLALAQRHAQLGNDEALHTVLVRVERLTSTTLNGQLMFMIEVGNLLCWRGRPVAAYGWQLSALMLLWSLGLASNHDLWGLLHHRMMFTLRQIARQSPPRVSNCLKRV